MNTALLVVLQSQSSDGCYSCGFVQHRFDKVIVDLSRINLPSYFACVHVVMSPASLSPAKPSTGQSSIWASAARVQTNV